MLRRTWKQCDITTLLRPSFSTLSCDALSWHIAPWLKNDQKEELQSLWTSLEDFDPKMPNRDPTDPELPAEPEELEGGEWNWQGCYQPLRWFFCPCALRKHDCAFTGEPPANCRGWDAVCCQEVNIIPLLWCAIGCLRTSRSVPMVPPQVLCTLDLSASTFSKEKSAHGVKYVTFDTASMLRLKGSSTACCIIASIFRRIPELRTLELNIP